MLKTFLQRGLPALFLLGLAYYLGRRHSPVVSAGQQQAPQAQAAAGSTGSAGAGKSPGKPGAVGGSPTGISEVFVGSADAFLKALFREPGMEETQYLLYNTVQHTPLETLISWAHEVAAMPSGRIWQPQVLAAIGKRWGAADPAAAMDWAQSLPNTGQRKQAVAAIMGGIARQNPAAALARLGELPDGMEKSEAIQGIAQEIGKTDPLQAIEMLKGRSDYQAQSVIRDALSTLTKSDPQGAVKLALTEEGMGQNNMLQTVFRAWALDDPAAALGAAAALPNKAQGKEAADVALSSWAQHAPMAALAHIKNLPESALAELGVGSALGNMTKANPKEALAAFAGLPAAVQRKQLANFAAQFAQNDVEAAFGWAVAMPNDSRRNDAIQQMGYALQGMDATRRDALIDSLPEGKARHAAVQSFIQNQAYNDPVGAAKMAMKLEPHQLTRVLNNSSLLHYLGDKDPELALKLAAQTGGRQSQSYAAQALQKLALSDLPKAEKLLATLEPAQQKEALPGIYGNLASKDGAAAMAKVSNIADQATKRQATQAVIQSWAQNDPDALLQWAQNAPAADRVNAQRAALQRKLADDAQGTLPAINALLQSAPTDAETTNALNNLCGNTANQLYREDPQAAAKWANTLTNETNRTTAVAQLASQWASEDPVEASVWVQGLPSGQAKDGAVQSLIQNIQDSDPSSAFAWAASIGGESARSRSVSGVYYQWKAQDPAAAAQALQTAPISETLRAQLLQPAEQPSDAFNVDPFSGN